MPSYAVQELFSEEMTQVIQRLQSPEFHDVVSRMFGNVTTSSSRKDDNYAQE